MSQNLIEKIAQKYAVGLEPEQKIYSGDYIAIQPAHILTHDNTGAVIGKFQAIGAKKIANPRQPVFALDHNVQDKSEENLKKYKGIEVFAKEMGVDFYPAGRGIGHQIMLEEGYAFPGEMAVASDSHSNMYGGIGCLGTPVVRTDAAGIWATGRTWWQIPPIAKIELIGELLPGVTGKDVIITLAGHFNKDEVLNHALEFSGDGVQSLSINDRLTISNMTTEWGALVGVFPIDNTVVDWLTQRNNAIKERGLEGVPSDKDGGEVKIHPRINKNRIKALQEENLTSDKDVYYSKIITIDLGTIRPHVAGPDNVKTTASITDIQKENIKINKAYLVSCVNSRVSDLADAAKVLKGQKVADDVEFYIAAASKEVQAESKKRGDWQILLKAGAIELPPGCGPCIGLGVGLLKDGEVGISATNRNFKGRMGSRDAKAYLASPAVVAASAMAGKICSPENFSSIELNSTIKISEKRKKGNVTAKLLNNFPKQITGEVIYCPQDNLNTDGIFPGKYTYIDDFSPKQQAEVVMENYDPDFGKIAKKGDVLVSGFNFGTGSSREQAATALKYRGIRLVIAGSFSQTYKRNAINNGFIVIESPDLVYDIKEKFKSDVESNKLTIRTNIELEIDFENSILIIKGKKYTIDPIGIAAQELVIEEGLENWVKNRL
ncbi:MAG: homoaconitase [Candidatus Marinimicrobia bacterium]|nr:homoaconitase [Candidatus Neomarinimicrobiota bacterium]